MKNIYFIIAVALIFFMLIIPLLTLTVNQKNNPTTQNPIINTNVKEFLVKDTQTGEIKNVPVSDYIFGVVAAEMPAEYESEALKAQAIAAYTYAVFKSQKNSVQGYHITNDYKVDQAFITKQEAREKWGDKADFYEQKITAAVNSVSGKYIDYNGQPILALYHAISGGKTESCEAVFGNSLPYLCGVDSSGDILNPDYQKTQSFTPEQFSTALKEVVELSGEPINWITEVKTQENGYIESVTVGGVTVKGTEIRKLLGLRSANFDVAFGQNFDFTVRGYGHGVGLSQSGADYLAKQGKTAEEIINWYYPGCTIKSN
ncbi:MAG: stage II sporulation protein D [Clostridia bacterium]|nr:stage II sporulation protein D [Clostridia bacterium]